METQRPGYLPAKCLHCDGDLRASSYWFMVPSGPGQFLAVSVVPRICPLCGKDTQEQPTVVRAGILPSGGIQS